MAFKLFTRKILKQHLRKTLVKMTYVTNSAVRL